MKKQIQKRMKAAVMAAKRKAAIEAKRELVIAKRKFDAAHKRANATIKSNPQKAVLLATAIGAAAGAAITAVAMRRRK